MAFPNLDLFLIDLFAAFIERIKGETDRFTLDDLFGDRPEEEREAVALYLSGVNIAKDIREREDGERYLYIIGSFPTMELPFPQIGVYIAPEDTSDFFVGNDVGIESEAVRDGIDTIIAWDQTLGCASNGTYWCDIICNTKDEVVWLSRICQRAIIEHLDDLALLNAIEPKISMGDLKPEQEHFPGLVFARRVTLTAKVFQTWKKRLTVGTYATGINKALEEG